jgi:glucosyl-3-phosphoglycerate phosphatase
MVGRKSRRAQPIRLPAALPVWFPAVLLALVRHGESTWNAVGRMQGQADPGLSETGRAQALALRPLVAGREPDVVVSSDLRRARETLELLGLGGATDPRWRETDVGDWTGRLVEDLVAEDAPAYRAWLENRHTPAGGEAWEEMRDRVVQAVLELAGGGAETALVVTHGGPIRACCAALAGLPRPHLVPVPTASITEIRVEARSRLVAFGVAPPRLVRPAPSDALA